MIKYILLILMLVSSVAAQDGCTAEQLNLTKLGYWAGSLPNSNPTVNWQVTLYSAKTSPNLLAAYLLINRSYTTQRQVAAHPVALPGKKGAKTWEFLFPSTKELVCMRILSSGKLQITQNIQGKENVFVLPTVEQGRELMLYNEDCLQWKQSLQVGKWSDW